MTGEGGEKAREVVFQEESDKPKETKQENSSKGEPNGIRATRGAQTAEAASRLNGRDRRQVSSKSPPQAQGGGVSYRQGLRDGGNGRGRHVSAEKR